MPASGFGIFLRPVPTASASLRRGWPSRVINLLTYVPSFPRMSLISADMDADGDQDIVVSDRKGKTPGCLWLENPGPGPLQAKPWTAHRIGGPATTMFITLADLDRDGLQDVLASVKPRKLEFHRRRSADGRKWETHEIPLPEVAGTAKAVAVADIDRDGMPDIVFSCEHADGDRQGVLWLSARHSCFKPEWNAHPISGPEGVKFDRLELIDLDGDGDLDVLTCEERSNLGVLWYENPTR